MSLAALTTHIAPQLPATEVAQRQVLQHGAFTLNRGLRKRPKTCGTVGNCPNVDCLSTNP